jgi:hypothetical protein
MKMRTPSALARDLEQAHQLGLLLEQVEQLAQAAHVAREILHREQVALAGDDDLLVALGIASLPACTAACISARSRRAALDLGLQALAHLLDGQAGVVRGQEVARLDQLRLRCSPAAVKMTRFCTSPSGATMITSTRRSDRRRNSMWWNTLALRGAVTTPTNCDRLDSSCAALAMTRCGWSACSCARSAARCAVRQVTRGCAVSMVSTKSR